ncbi:MAG: pilus assembly protein PilM [Phycisphaeraceae bacterium]
MANRWFEKTKSFLMAGPPTKLVALDLEARRLRVVHAEPYRGTARVQTMASIDLPEDVDSKDAQAVGVFIGEALRKLGLTGMRVLMDVPRSQAVLKPLSLPPVDNERELPAMVRYQVEKELPFPIEQAVIDFTIDHYPSGSGAGGAEAKSLSSKAGQTDVLVAAVQRSVVEHYQKIAAAAGIRLQSLGLRPYADVRCLEACLKRDLRSKVVLLVHVLENEAEINVLIEGALTFSRSAALRQHDEAGLALADKEIIESLVVEIARSAQSALSSHRGRKIDEAYIVGDTGHETAVIDVLSQRIRIPVKNLSVVDAFSIKADGENPSGFTSPLGLAVAHGSTDRMPFDFLHPKKPPVERDVKKIRRIAVAVAAGVLLLVGTVMGLSARSEADARLADLKKRKDKLDKDVKPVEKLAARVSGIESWVKEGEPWLDHWAKLSSCLPPATDIYITGLKSNSNGSLAVVVRARSSKVITDMSAGLRAAGYDVKLGAETTSPDEFGYRYSTTMTLTAGDEMKIEPVSLTAPARPRDDGSAELIKRSRSSSSSSSSSRFGREGGTGDERSADPRGNGEGGGREDTREATKEQGETAPSREPSNGEAGKSGENRPEPRSSNEKSDPRSSTGSNGSSNKTDPRSKSSREDDRGRSR